MYIVEPEVSCEIGLKSEFSTAGVSSNYKSLHIVLFGWSGDDIIESFPFYFFSAHASEVLLKAGLNNIEFKEVDLIEVDSQYLEYIKKKPDFKVLKLLRNSREISITEGKLNISEKVKKLLSKLRLRNCRIYKDDDRESLDSYLNRMGLKDRNLPDKSLDFLCKTYNLKR